MNKKTTFATIKQSLELKQNPSIVHSGLAKILSQKIDKQVPEKKIIKNEVNLFKD